MSIRSMKILMGVDLALCVMNAYVGAAALMRSDWLWTAIGLGLSLMMANNFFKRRAILKGVKPNDRTRQISD